MPKLKTNKGVAKRFKITAKGKIKRSKAFKGHLKGSKNRKRKRILKRPANVDRTEEKKIKFLLPYK